MDADAVIFIHAPMRLRFPNFRVIEIAKNRSGELARFFIDFVGKQQRFAAPSISDTRIWSAMMQKRGALNAEELEEARRKAEEDVKRTLEKEQAKRHRREKEPERGEEGRGEQMVIGT